MSVPVVRKYSHSDSIMLTAVSTLVENAITHKAIIIPKRAIWVDPYLVTFQTRIDLVIKDIFGVDNAKELRVATQTVNAMQLDALHKLGLINTEITQDFKNTPARRTEILTTLGFKEFYKEAYQSGSHSSFVNLLYRFNQNMTDPLKAEIVAKGTEEASIDEIMAMALTLKNANVTQSTFKVNRPVLTEDTIKAFNDIYSEGIALGTICAKIFAADKAVKETFSYSKITNLLKPPTPKPTPPVPPVPPVV